MGDLSTQAQELWFRLICGKNALTIESLARWAEELRCDLGRPNQTAAEDLVIERIISAWLHTHFAEQRVVGAEQLARDGHQVTPVQRATFLTQLAFAERRYLLALKTLATQRKLLLPRSPTVRTVGTPRPGGSRGPRRRQDHLAAVGAEEDDGDYLRAFGKRIREPRGE